LEERNPVSSLLVSGLLEAGAAATPAVPSAGPAPGSADGAGLGSGRLDTAGSALPVTAALPVSAASPDVPTTGASLALTSAGAPASPSSTTPAPGPAGTLGDTLGSPAGTSGAPMITLPTAPSPVGIPGGPAAASSGAPAPSGATSRGSIRPLSMAPPAPTQTVAPGSAFAPSTATGAAKGRGLPTMSGGGSGGGGGGNASLTSGGEAIVGGVYQVGVVVPGKQLQSTSYTIAGAEQSQTYRNLSGSTTDLPSPVNHTPTGSMSDNLTFYWNATPGDHAVSVSYTCTDGTSGTLSTTINITKPTVSDLSFTYGPFSWGITPGGSLGFFEAAAPNNMQLSATVSEPAGVSGGNAQWCWIQKINFRADNTNTLNGTSTDYVYSTGGWVLDNDPDLKNDNDAGYPFPTTPFTVNVGGSTPGTADDQPWWRFGQDANSGPCTDFKVSYQFDDYVMFKPNAGIWVYVAETSSYLSMSGEEQLVNGNWQVVTAATPNANGSINWINPSYGLLTWNNYFTKMTANSNPPFP
jgi:hypothetical protein